MIETMAMTVVTPMTMPRTVSAERSLYAVSARAAKRTFSRAARMWSRARMSIRPQRVDWRQVGSTPGREVSRGDAGDDGHHQSADHQRRRHERRQGEGTGDPEADEDAQEHAGDAAAEREQNRLGQKLKLDGSLARAKGAANADLSRPLHHRHQHDVGDHDAADNERDAGDEDHQREPARRDALPERLQRLGRD